MVDKVWLQHYPEGVPTEINLDQCPESIVEVFEKAVVRWGNQPAFSALGQTITYTELEEQTQNFAAYIQNETDLQPGDTIAVQLPNVLQYPVAVFGAMRAGLIVVNTNPLYTPREMAHQFKDAGVKAVVILANFAKNLQDIIPETQVKHVIVTELGDMSSPLKRLLVNSVVKYVKKLVPEFYLPKAKRFVDVLDKGKTYSFNRVNLPSGDDVAVLQYTGGTTGVAKGAMLTHRNIVSNMMQAKNVFSASLTVGTEVMIAPLPLYHIYGFTMSCLAQMELGSHVVLIPNPRDIPAFVKELQNWKFSLFCGLNT